MAYIASNPQGYLGKVVGTGQCVAYVQKVSSAPTTAHWHEGRRVLDIAPGSIARGTVIATMVHGEYPNHSTGNHAAIYLHHADNGIVVLDQWVGQPVHERTIHDHGGSGSASNDAGRFYVVEWNRSPRADPFRRTR